MSFFAAVFHVIVPYLLYHMVLENIGGGGISRTDNNSSNTNDDYDDDDDDDDDYKNNNNHYEDRVGAGRISFKLEQVVYNLP
jgi:hypothetical protein